MTIAAVPPAATAPGHPAAVGLPVWQAPLVPIAVAMTAGILLDRAANVPLAFSLIAAAASLLLFAVHCLSPQTLLRLLYLWAGFVGLGAAYQHVCRYGNLADDVRHMASEEGQPARLRGVIDSPPAILKGTGHDPLRSFPRNDTTRFVLRVTALLDSARRTWREASGLVRVSAAGRLDELAAGDELEIVGRLALPEPPANPGEFDYASYLADRDISATVAARDAGSVVVRERAHGWRPAAWPALVRGWGQRVLASALPAPHGDLAAALLLGDSPGMTTDDWDIYLRTGVIHVLAISGQHLVVLAGFLWLALRLTRVRRRRGALIVALILIFYALVAGGRPPVMRSAWMVLAYSGGVLLMRPASPANTFALAWLLVALTNPADVANAGCQLSFLAVAVLVWGVPGITAMANLLRYNLFGNEPLAEAITASRPLVVQLLYSGFRTIGEAYLLNALVWLAVTPLAAYHFHLISPIALVIGPPLVLLTSIALLAGFAVLLLAPVVGLLAWPFTLAAQWSLAGCASLADIGAHAPCAYFYVPDIPAWWLWTFYTALLVVLALRVPVRYPVPAFAGLCAGLALGLLLLLWPHRPGEFRCTFLAVGHGGCAVLETPEGHVLLYDAGSIGGPDVTRRIIAPFLWHRGIRRIDELIVSHADLDHFNGIPDLVERFAIGRITHTPTFPQRDLEAVRVALTAIERRGIPMRVVSAGDRWNADELTLEVLHPPADGPDGKENVRSLVLLVRHRDVSILLTGDLEDTGLAQVVTMPPRRVAVLMGPHHGSAKANTTALATWANPRVVVLCQGRSDNTSDAAKAYAAMGSTVFGTWPHGAVTLRHSGNGAWVETFRTARCHELAGLE